MAWTYSGDPQTSDKDAVRFYCGDTEEEFGLLQDEEIEYILNSQKRPDVKLAAIKACEQILAKLAKQVDYTIGPETVKASQRYKAYEGILRRLKKDVVGANAAPVMGGWHPPIFSIGMHDAEGGWPWIRK